MIDPAASLRTLASALVIALLLVAGCTSSSAPSSPTDPFEVPKDEWTSLFNGQNLDGWTPKISGYEPGENMGNTFRVEDSLITVRYDAYDTFDSQFGHLVSDTSFSHYALAIEYRFYGGQVPGGPDWAIQNSGAMIHSQSAESMTVDQDFPISIELQFLGAAGQEDRATANLATPGTHVVMNDTLVTTHQIWSSSATYPGSEWVLVEALVLGDSLVQHRVNGKKVIEYTETQIGMTGVVHNADSTLLEDGAPLTEGHIALQSESHPIKFRTVKVLNLEGCTDPEAANYEAYYVKSDPAACEYEG